MVLNASNPAAARGPSNRDLPYLQNIESHLDHIGAGITKEKGLLAACAELADHLRNTMSEAAQPIESVLANINNQLQEKYSVLNGLERNVENYKGLAARLRMVLNSADDTFDTSAFQTNVNLLGNAINQLNTSAGTEISAATSLRNQASGLCTRLIREFSNH